MKFSLNKEKNKSFRNIILIVILIDIFIFGIYFGSSRIIVDRFSFLENEFAEIKNLDINISRIQVIKFALYQAYDYLIFGYGPGSFEILFQS